MSQSSDEEQEQEQAEADPLSNLLSLQLRKPPHWNWELSTSRSCSNIALPRILLYDHTGALLVDAQGSSEQTYRSTDAQGPGQGLWREPQRRRKRSATSNLSGSLAHDFHGLHIAEATPSPSRSRERSHTGTGSGSCIEINTHELPNWEPGSVSGSSRRSSSLRGVRFLESPQPLVEQEEEEQEEEVELPVYPTPPSTSTTTMTTTTANSSSSGPREKRRYRRSHSSILERFSMSRGRHSSPEYAQERDIEMAPRYYLRTSKAGTLVIREESFSRMRQRRRRPPKHSSSENILQDGRPESAQSAQSAVQATTRRRHQEAAAAAAAAISTSEEEQLEEKPRPSHGRQSRGRRTQRSCVKDVAQELITVDPDNCVYRAAPGATAR
ncbi:uncharacterized protein LOC111081240 [Drosophila obscura]|uniref:uncharacterized protein LOC111081240 n=1 Tax=Drosophila obscura TaxID=7282 RepID=UPI001BB2937D|nr:uncharacterized protein LOC111081240 [Drosophila obscura]